MAAGEENSAAGEEARRQADSAFVSLVARVRSGDAKNAEAAFNELVDRYGAAIRRTARLRLSSVRLKRLYESGDIFQSVLKSFFFRLAAPESNWELDTPAQLVNLLVSMTRNKVTDKTRRETTKRRGGHIAKEALDNAPEPVSHSRTPAEEAELRELARKFTQSLDPEAQAIASLRYANDLEWNEIGELLGSSGDACRNRLNRALKTLRELHAKDDRPRGPEVDRA